ncbi:hypothetical protein J2S70_001224 [Trueperella bonasi]|uniref:DUF3180 domain-containing protein n=1 Tax=Trueperella bonasi TaxID=312286 RepID=A0ABT9NGW4_9ACTO|nr:DUF3180 domain-containing protein [Trueperella bonasi]MDP9806642.1 hypothetical protein [Trueperella bonasi]
MARNHDSYQPGKQDREPGGKLRPTSIWMLVAVGTVASVTLFMLITLLLRSGGSPIAIHSLLFFAPILIGVAVAWQAWLVRSYKLGRRNLDPLYAARIWVLTQATSRVGALMTGGAAGISLAYWWGGPTSFLSEQAINAGLAALGSLVMTALAIVGERWCIVDDEDGGQPDIAQAGV